MSALKYFFGVVARPQTWLDYVYLWLAFPLGLFYFIFLVVGLSVGLSLVIVWVGIPMLLLVAGAWYLFAAFERVLARELLRVPVAPAPRAWESADGVWNKLKAHFASGSTWKDLVYLLARLPLGIVSFTIVTTQAGLAVAFIGAPFFQRVDALWLGGQRIDSFGVALALVPLGVLLVIALFHVVHGWAWVCGKLATALFGDARVAPAPAQAGPPVWTPSATAPQAPHLPQWPQGTQPPLGPQGTQPPESAQPSGDPQGAGWSQPPQTPPVAPTGQWPPARPAPGLKYPPGIQWPQPPQGTQPPQAAQWPQGAQPPHGVQAPVAGQPQQGAAQGPLPQPGPDSAPAPQQTPRSPASPPPETTAPPAEAGTPGGPAAPTADAPSHPQ